jgi:hypothetical protein
LTGHLERPIGEMRVVSHTLLAAVGGGRRVQAQELVFLGGPTTAPGYEFHELVGSMGFSQRLEWQLPIPFISVPLGRFGRAPARALLAPFAQLAVVVGDHDPVRRTILGRGVIRVDGGYPSLGVGVLTLFEMVRFDVARGLREGRWSFSADLVRDFWRIL